MKEIYRRGQFFVAENTLTDNSKTYDVCVSVDGAGAGPHILIDASPASENEAQDVCDALADVILEG